MNHRYAVLLTATIDPGPYADQVRRRDPAVRLNDYAQSLRNWTTAGGPQIGSLVLCDNSGYDPTALAQLAATLPLPVEVLSFNGNKKPSGTHYGYSELGIIDYAIAHSQILRDSRYFIKATGRLQFPNLPKLLQRLDVEFDAAVDHRRRYRNETGPSTRARTQLMLFNTAFYRAELLNSRIEMLGVCSHIEEFLAAKLSASRRPDRIIRRFPIECPPSGIGGNGGSYDNLSVRTKNLARALARRCLPQVWL